jgi:galactokinase
MEFTPISAEIEKLIEYLRNREKFADSNLNVVVSPYRISPLGAHIDHQGGPVLGMTINTGSLLAFIENHERKVRLYSMNYPGVVEFSIENIKTTGRNDWGRYAMGAAKVIQEWSPIELGFTGVITGTLPASGLSSSASVGLAYLKALAYVNNRIVSNEDYVELDSGIENNYLKLQNGILDQSSIVYGKKNSMLYIDTVSAEVTAHLKPESTEDFKILILYSGLTHELTSSGFNTRVEACRKTAGLLGLMVGLNSAKTFSDIPEEVYLAQQKRLPEDLKHWAIHYFSEVGRVKKGIKAWDAGELEKFGSLMNESSGSTLQNYENGSPQIRDLFERTISQDGVYGAAINGGGYGGCVVTFVRNDFSENSALEILSAYTKEYPELKEKAQAYFAEPDEGLRLL